MWPWAAAAAGAGLLGAGLLLGLAGLARHLWALRWALSRDPACPLPLPPGSMGWPFLGETLHWMLQVRGGPPGGGQRSGLARAEGGPPLLQGSRYQRSRRQRYGPVFKTHLLGRPVIRVSGAQHVRTILLGEHRLVRSHWPRSARILLGPHTLLGAVGEPHRQRRRVLSQVFSRSALESYLPPIQAALRRELRGWCGAAGPVAVFAATKALTFRIAARVLLGLRLEERRCAELARTFEQLVENLFSLPLDLPFSGLRKGIRARDRLHEHMEAAIAEKLQAGPGPGAGPSDALDLIIISAREQGREVTMQELKESAVELMFAAFFTTASASTSLVLLLLQHPAAVSRIRQELSAHQLGRRCPCPCPRPCPCLEPPRDGRARPGDRQLADPRDPGTCPRLSEAGPGQGQRGSVETPAHQAEEATCRCPPDLSLDQLGRLRYLDWVVKEVLRLLPPVSGGYRTALRTFELDGYQVPQGWSVMYSIRDTHEMAAVYHSPPDGFDPERFGPRTPEGGRGPGRFHYIPFGGGVRSCLGQELARTMLKLLAVELVRTARWELATPAFPDMHTIPIVHPADGLRLLFHHLPPDSATDPEAPCP
ncbi:cytochrome P450 26C1 [Tachyglossus aculeatus]|uniref:cytochrome P450 26C1 n=1 Tax=Tachyglossus aculeatus TaxID=9261 RepID=UPI0018F64BCB|nr:cytochrome P450 26C1 [Tachyglossus aculeatus]